MARRNHDKNGSTITPLIGNGVTAQKNLVNMGKGKALTPGGREKKNRKKNIAETTTVVKEKNIFASDRNYYLL